MAGGAVIAAVVIALLATSGGGGSGSANSGSTGNIGSSAGSSSSVVGGVDESRLLWEFHVSCGELAANAQLAHDIAYHDANYANSPLGIDHSAQLIEQYLSQDCQGVDPSYSPAQQAEEQALAAVQNGQ